MKNQDLREWKKGWHIAPVLALVLMFLLLSCQPDHEGSGLLPLVETRPVGGIEATAAV